MFKIFNKIRKPKITAKLISRGTKTKVTVKGCDVDQAMTLIYMLTKKVAEYFGISHRQLLNGIIGIDKRIVRAKKKEEKQARYGKKK